MKKLFNVNNRKSIYDFLEEESKTSKQKIIS
jgi:hypothetical protein